MTQSPGFLDRVEPLRASHDRSAFYCGVSELDRYLHERAGLDARRKVAAPFVPVDKEGAIAGYYTLSACAIRLGELPKTTAKRLPRYPLLPATLLGRLATGGSYCGQSLGRLLLMDALHRSWRNTSEVASVGVVVEALDESALAFYLHYEFQPLRDHPDRLFLAMSTIERAFKPTGA